MTVLNSSPTQVSHARHILVLVALVNLAQGLGQVDGVIYQPLVYYFKEALGWAPDQVTRFLALLIIPWIVRPVYGLLSDFVPILGYHRRPYIILFNLLALAGFLWLHGISSPTFILVSLYLTAFGMAGASTITEALMVESGRKLGMSARFLNAQWLWFNIASVTASLLGGFLAEHLSPDSAFRTAAWIAAFPPVLVAFATWYLMEEPWQFNRTAATQAHQKTDMKALWITAAFLFLWCLIPSFGTPLYYHMTDNMKFSQQFIGVLSAVTAIGAVLGAFAHGWCAKRYGLKKLLYLTFALEAVSLATYLCLFGRVSALAISLLHGADAMVTLVVSQTLAAHSVPGKNIGFWFAILMSICNLGMQLSNNVGAWLYTRVFNEKLDPVVYIAVACTVLCALLVRYLRPSHQPPDPSDEKDSLDDQVPVPQQRVGEGMSGGI